MTKTRLPQRANSPSPLPLLTLSLTLGLLFANALPAAPVVENAGYIPEAGFATLSGNVVSTGGAPTQVTIYWGPDDGV
ncbi:MAG: hypothetical protein QGH15_05595, partial [Kiritimatiellia bacterium]|nr:hypothetical protein [Kiritimatiellia bacterium]